MHKFYKEWTVYEAIDALMAYDHGATDSGVHDDVMKDALRTYLEELNGNDLDKLCCGFVLNRINSGYGLEDVHNFILWLGSEMQLDF